MVQTEVLLWDAPLPVRYEASVTLPGEGISFPAGDRLRLPHSSACHRGGTVTLTGFADYAGNNITARVMDTEEEGRVLIFPPGTFVSAGEEPETDSHASFVFDGTAAEVLVPFPYDKIYPAYLAAMIDFAHGEFSRCQNSMALFNSHFKSYQKWYARVYAPADQNREE